MTSNITILGTDGADGITTLTIDPGVEVRFNQSTQLTVGASSGSPGALVAQGAAATPITFTSNQATPTAGNWYGIRFFNTTDDATSIMEYCIIDYAGYSNGAIYSASASPRITNNTIRNSNSYGIYIYSGAATVSGNIFSGNGNYDIYFTSPAGGVVSGNTINNGIYLSATGVGDLNSNIFNCNPDYPIILAADDVGKLMGNTFNNASSGSYLKVNGGTITKDATWQAIMPYHIQGNITVQGTDGTDGITTLTIAPGVELRFNLSTQLTVGASSGNPGALVAQGALSNPVVFTTNQATPIPGNWSGLSFQNTARDNSSIVELCLIEYATNGLYIVNAKPIIQGNTLRRASNAGLYISGTGSNDMTVECNTFIDNKYGIYTSSALPLVHHNDLVNNTLYGMNNASVTQVNAENNWWGIASDPGTEPNMVYGAIDYTPWSTAINDCKSNYGSSDTTPPELVSADPNDGALLQSLATVSFTLHDQETDIDDFAVINSVIVQQDGGNTVPGSTTENNDTFLFTPASLPLADGTYTVSFNGTDVIGNAASYSFSFTIDTQGPEKPVITGGLVASGTIQERPGQNIADTISILLTGTAENGNSLWINDHQYQPITAGTWSATLDLVEGDNAFEVWVEDVVGNRSPAAWVDVWHETSPMMRLEYDDAGRLNNLHTR